MCHTFSRVKETHHRDKMSQSIKIQMELVKIKLTICEMKYALSRIKSVNNVDMSTK